MNIIRFIIKSVLLIYLLVALQTGCSIRPSTESELLYGLTLSPSGLDPHLNASAELGIPLRSVYDTLVYLDPQSGKFVPGLATEWSISDDGTQYTFGLRRDVRFHDGVPFNAQAVKANIEYILDPDHHSQKAAGLLGPIEQVKVVDEFHVALILEQPFAPLLDSLSQVYLGMASPDALEHWGPSEYQFHQVGTGPYRFVEYVPDDHILLELNPDYDWAPEIYRNRLASYDRVKFRFFEDVATRAIALENGSVDIIGEIPARDAERFARSDKFTLHPIAIPGQPLQYLFNTALEPTNDVLVRTALILAVDREQIVETIFGSTSPVARGPLSAKSFNHLLTTPLPSYDATAALQMLQEAGWEPDQSGRLHNELGDALTLHIVAPIWGSNPEVAQLLKVAWESLGAEVTLEIAPGFGPLREAQSSGNYHAIGINFFGTDPDLLRPMFTSDGLYNWSGYANDELDNTLLQAAQATLDPDHRQTLYQRSIQHIVSQAVVLPIRDYVNLVVADRSVTGLSYSAPGWFPLLIDFEPAS